MSCRCLIGPVSPIPARWPASLTKSRSAWSLTCDFLVLPVRCAFTDEHLPTGHLQRPEPHGRATRSADARNTHFT